MRCWPRARRLKWNWIGRWNSSADEFVDARFGAPARQSTAPDRAQREQQSVPDARAPSAAIAVLRSLTGHQFDRFIQLKLQDRFRGNADFFSLS